MEGKGQARRPRARRRTNSSINTTNNIKDDIFPFLSIYQLANYSNYIIHCDISLANLNNDMC